MTNLPPKPPQLEWSRESDLLIFELNGDYTLEVAKFVQAVSEIVCGEYGYHMHMTNVRNAGPITPEARKFVLTTHENSRLRGASAIVGANFAVRTLAQMVLRAMHVIVGTPVTFRFCVDETEARVWLDEQRIRLKAQASS